MWRGGVGRRRSAEVGHRGHSRRGGGCGGDRRRCGGSRRCGGDCGIVHGVVHRCGNLLARRIGDELHGIRINARVRLAGESALSCAGVAHLHETFGPLLELIGSEWNPDIRRGIRRGRPAVLVQHDLPVAGRGMHFVDHSRGVARIRVGHIHIVFAVGRDIRSELCRASRNEALVQCRGPREARRLALGGAFQPRAVNLLERGVVLAVGGRLDDDLALLGEEGRGGRG